MACYCGCGAAVGSWEGFWRHRLDGAYGTHPAVDERTAYWLTHVQYCMFFTTLSKYFTHTENIKALLAYTLNMCSSKSRNKIIDIIDIVLSNAKLKIK